MKSPQLQLHLLKLEIVRAQEIDSKGLLHRYGIDSLSAVEVRNWLFEMLKNARLKSLAALVTEKNDL